MFSVTRTLHLPKEGNSDEQYEDAFAVRPEPAGRGEAAGALTVALSDGASSAIFAREWARLLVDSFCADGAFPETDDALFARVGALGGEWRAAVSGKATRWYAQERLPSGSSATLLLARCTGDGPDGPKLSALAAGDVCLFVVRDGRLKYGFPKTRSRQFDDRPGLLTTETASAPADRRPPVLRFETPLQPGDRLLLMTDALAQFFLSEFEAKRKPWDALPAPDALPVWAKARRDSGDLKNDDVTLLEVACH